MNCRPCLYVFLITGGFFLLSGLVIFALGVLKLVIRDGTSPEKQSQTEWKLFKPTSSDDIFSQLINQNSIFVLICGLLAIVLAVFILFPGWLCLRRSDRLKRRRQLKLDAEGGHIEDAPPGTQIAVQVDAHGGIESRPTDPLLSHAGVTAVEVSVNGIPRAVHEDEEGSPIREKEKYEHRYQLDNVHTAGPQVNGHENPLYNLEEEKLRQHAGPVVTTHSTQQHYYENESKSFQSDSNENVGLGPVAPVPALAVHRVVEEEDENYDDEGEPTEDGQQAGDPEDPPFANENYVYASVKRTDRHSRSPSDESKTGVQPADATSPRSSVNEEGRSALMQKAHDLVDEVLRAASDTSTSHSMRMSAEYAAAQENPYETCDSPIPSVHEEDEIPPLDEEAAKEAEEEADHRSVTSSEEGDACFNAPTPEVTHTSNSAILEEEEEEEEPADDPVSDHERYQEHNGQISHETGLLIGASDVQINDQHSDHDEEADDRHSGQIVEEENVEDEEEPDNSMAEYQFENIPQHGVSEPPPPNIAIVHEEEEEEEEEERNEMDESEDTADPNANTSVDEEEPALPAHPMDFGFGPPELIINAPSKEPSVEDDEEEDEIESELEQEPTDEGQHSEGEELPHEDVNANMAGAALVHISPEDDVEISELLGPQVLQASTHSEQLVEELPPPSSPSPPPPPPPGLPGEAFMKMDSPAEQEGDVDLLGDVGLPAPENSLLDMGVYEGEPVAPDKHPPPAAHEQFGDLVNFDDPEDCSSTPPPPPPPPPPPIEEEGGWHTEF